MSGYGVVESMLEGMVGQLRGNAPLISAVTEIYNDVPQATALPYVLLSLSRCVMRDNMAQRQVECRVDVEIYSNYAGDKQALDIGEVLYELLHQQVWSVGGGSILAVEATEWQYARVDELARSHVMPVHVTVRAD